MDQLLPHLLAFPPHPPPAQPLSDNQYDADIKTLLQHLNKTSASHLVGGVQGGGDLLDILDPAINSLPYLYTLRAHSQAQQDRHGKASSNIGTKQFAIDPSGPLWKKAVYFFERFDARQIRYAGLEWRRLLELMETSARAHGKPLVAVRPFRNAILRLDPESSTLTSNHVLFVRLCLEAQTFRTALPILDRNILEFPMSHRNIRTQPCTLDQPSSGYITPTSGLSARLSYTDHLEYHLCGAMLYIGLKRWERALEFLEYVLSTPTSNAVSSLMVEAYKKWVLVGLIHRGKQIKLPSTVTNTTAKTLSALSKPYDGVAEVFRTGNLQRLTDEVNAGADFWRKDKNTGLLTLVLSAHPRYSLVSLENTFSTLSLPHIASRRLPSHEPYLLSLIASSQLSATLSYPSASSAPILHFGSASRSPAAAAAADADDDDADPTTTHEAARLAAIDEQIEKVVVLTRQIRAFERRTALGPTYVTYAAKAKKMREREDGDRREGVAVGGGLGSGGGGATDAMAMDMDVGALDVDEDVMADF